MTPKRTTRRRIAYTLTGCVVAVFGWMMLPNDIGVNEAGLASVIVPSMVLGLVGFITGEAFNDNSERKYDKD